MVDKAKGAVKRAVGGAADTIKGKKISLGARPAGVAIHVSSIGRPGASALAGPAPPHAARWTGALYFRLKLDPRWRVITGALFAPCSPADAGGR
jgi:hypothetical protein